MEQFGISKLDLKRQNRIQILKTIRNSGPISRVEIASKLDITRAAVTIITNEMMEQGLLIEVGEAPNLNERMHKGRRKIMITINQNYKFAIGVTIEKNLLTAGLSTLNGDVLDKYFIATNQNNDFDAIIEFIIQSCEKMVSNSCLLNDDVLGVGIGIMPDMYETMGITKNPNGRSNYSKIVASLKDKTNFPIICGNAVGMLAIANLDFKSTFVKNKNQLFLCCGEQYSLSVISNNELLKSCLYHSENINNFIVNTFNGETLEGYPNGAVKAELTLTSIIKKIKKEYSAVSMPVLYQITSGNAENINQEYIQLALKNNDKKVAEIISAQIEMFAVLIHNLLCTHHAESIVLHHSSLNEDELQLLKKKISNISGKEISDSLSLSKTGGKYAFLGGCAMVVREFFLNRGGILR